MFPRCGPIPKPSLVIRYYPFPLIDSPTADSTPLPTTGIPSVHLTPTVSSLGSSNLDRSFQSVNSVALVSSTMIHRGRTPRNIASSFDVNIGSEPSSQILGTEPRIGESLSLGTTTGNDDCGIAVASAERANTSS